MSLPVVDARSGKIVKIGEVVTYPGGEWWQLLGVKKLRRGVGAAFIQSSDYLSRWVPMPIKYKPRKLIYGPWFPSGAKFVGIFPS